MSGSDGIIVIGYSGHAFVACDLLRLTGWTILGYCEKRPKIENPFDLDYLGEEGGAEARQLLESNAFFVAIGDNRRRRAAYAVVSPQAQGVTLIHPAASLSENARIGDGVLICAGAVVGPLANIGIATIINSGAVVEHECQLGDFVHVAPGAVLCGAVNVGAGALIGAGAVVRQGIQIGRDAVVGAGAVVVKNVPDAATVYGNPARPVEESYPPLQQG